MKKEMEKFWDGKIFNNQGQVVVSENPDLDTAGMQWIKRNMKASRMFLVFRVSNPPFFSPLGKGG